MDCICNDELTLYALVFATVYLKPTNRVGFLPSEKTCIKSPSIHACHEGINFGWDILKNLRTCGSQTIGKYALGQGSWLVRGAEEQLQPAQLSGSSSWRISCRSFLILTHCNYLTRVNL